jgi:hypothetical protein
MIIRGIQTAFYYTAKADIDYRTPPWVLHNKVYRRAPGLGYMLRVRGRGRVRDKVMRTSSQGWVEINATRAYGVGLGIHKL